MGKASWIKLAKEQSLWSLYFTIQPPVPVPSIKYWLRIKSVDEYTKRALNALAGDNQVGRLLERAKVSLAELATVIVFCNVAGGWFDKTIMSFRRHPPRFPYTDDIPRLKLQHTIGNIYSLICNKNKELAPCRATAITRRIIGVFEKNITNQFLVKIIRN